RAADSPVADAGGRRALLAAAALAGLSYAFKAQLFLLFGGAFGLAILALFLRDRARALVAAAALTALVFAAVFALSRVGGSTATVQWRPGLFADLYIYPNLRRDPARAVDRALMTFFASVPGGRGYLLAVPFALWRIVAFSPLVPAYVIDVLRRARSAGISDAVFAAAFLLALPMGYGFSVVSFYAESSPFEFRQAAHGLALLGAVVTVCVGHALLARRGVDAGLAVLATMAAASLAVAPFLAGAPPYVPARAEIVLGADEQCALLFLRHHTPPDAVVASVRGATVGDLQPRGLRLNHQAVVSGFAGRRAVLEFYGKEVDGRNDRVRDLRRLFTTTDPAVAAQVLERYGVDHVLESPALPLRFPKDRLRPVFDRAGWRVYEVLGADRGAGPRPEGGDDRSPPDAPGDLRCATP
ncbi:MAG TPA: hypothetical protein VGQ33_01850, partial [Vicinamibacteria bacterium]|nr:hypothetical protein [Vicinamibacteria bacterium]